ncbi:MAG: exodeoxyribonuclease VII large subunit [Bacteroidales bacterium]|nr:exodeoxyribonuclease VII large subunit [Bacteroidales bacterium]
MQNDYLDLLTLQTMLKRGVESVFPDRIWVRGEISGISHRQNGHCYMDLCQSSRSGAVEAKAHAAIWASRWPWIDRRFREVTGSPLESGMEILARISVTYHPVYGLTLTIDDIDPEFTLGAAERQRKLTIQRLTDEGLIDLQKELALPQLPYSLAVISAATAAGYGDFCNHLLNNEYGFVFKVDLYEALMQGEKAPSSMIEAFGAILASDVRYDAILVLRGGGSDLDLACFDDYDLASTIAQCPVPVITAIGHDRDFHVADMVANAYVKTPTALADLFLDCFIAEDQRLGSLESRLSMAFSRRLSSMDNDLVRLESGICSAADAAVSKAEHRIDLLETAVQRRFVNRLSEAGTVLDRSEYSITLNASKRLEKASLRLSRIEKTVSDRVGSVLAEALSHLMKIETRIETTDPRNILRKGFVLALDRNGVKMDSASMSRVGDRVQMMFADGTLKCGVVEIDNRSNIPSDEDSQVSDIRQIG